MTAARLYVLLVVLWIASENAMLFFRRSKGGKSSGRLSVSNLVLWGAMSVAVSAALLARYLTWAHFGGSGPWLFVVAIAALLAGLAIRWWAILVLGQFFTIDLAVHAGHRIVQSGPYRWVRHPSYTGLLVVFLGVGLGMRNWISVACILVPVTAAIAYRIHVEEQMLRQEFGDAYAEYRRHTRRLLPGIF